MSLIAQALTAALLGLAAILATSAVRDYREPGTTVVTAGAEKSQADVLVHTIIPETPATSATRTTNTVPAIATSGPLVRTRSSTPGAAALAAPITAPTAAEIIILGNVERTNRGLSALAMNPDLSAAALAKANDMIARGYFAHTAPDGSDISDLAKRYGYAYLNIGENLAMGDFESSREMVDGWMNSPGHRANMLSPVFSEIGVAVGRGRHEGREVWFGVQEFGRPRGACPEPSATLKSDIDTNAKTLEEYAVRLAALRRTLDMPETSNEEYRNAVTAHNALVVVYNSLIARSKSQIVDYNAAVREFNDCIALLPATGH